MLGPGQKLNPGKQPKPMHQLTSYLSKKVKDGVKAIPKVIVGGDGVRHEPDPDDYDEHDAWGDVKKAKETVIAPSESVKFTFDSFG